jgi:hypothetical protein
VVQIKKIQQVQQILLIQLNNKGINKMISLVLAALVACSTENAATEEVKATTTPTVVETETTDSGSKAAEQATATNTETVVVPTTEATPAPATTTGASK